MEFKTSMIIAGLVLFAIPIFGQNEIVPTEKETEVLQDTLISVIGLKEVTVVGKRDALSEEKKTQIRLLIRRVYKVYPYAKLTSEKLKQLQANLDNLKKKKDKKRYLKLVEKYIEDEYEDRLKRFSRKEGQILVKLINRQTGTTTFDILDEYKSSWTAFWYNKIGSLYNIDIKMTYNPKDVQEDYLIEQILYKGFRSGHLQYQAPHQPIDINELAKHWADK